MALFDGLTVGERGRRIKRNNVTLHEAARYFGRLTVAMADADRQQDRLPVLDHENRPAFAMTEQGGCRDLEHILATPDHDSRFDPETVAESSARFGGAVDSDHDGDTLLFHPEGRNFGRSDWIDTDNGSLQFPCPAPAGDYDRRADPHLHGIRTDKVDPGFEIACDVPNFQDCRASRNDRFIWFDHPKDHAIGW